MGNKAQKCCCCPECTVTGGCCGCVCQRICVTLAGDGEDCECRTASVELPFNTTERSFLGTLTCGGMSVDLRYFFETEYGVCYLKLRSVALGYPEGQERQWRVGPDFDCETMATSITVDLLGLGAYACPTGTLTTACVPFVKPVGCAGCKCMCECICVTVLGTSGRKCTGKLCWDGYSDLYSGNVRCDARDVGDYVDLDHYVELRYRPRSEVDPYADPYDDSCVAVLSIPTLGVTDQWVVAACGTGAVNLTYQVVVSPYETLTITTRCAKCNESCDVVTCVTCASPLPRVMTVRVSGCANGSSSATFTAFTDLGPNSIQVINGWISGPIGCIGCIVINCVSEGVFVARFFKTDCRNTDGAQSYLESVFTVTCDPLYAAVVIPAGPFRLWADTFTGTGCCVTNSQGNLLLELSA